MKKKKKEKRRSKRDKFDTLGWPTQICGHNSQMAAIIGSGG